MTRYWIGRYAERASGVAGGGGVAGFYTDVYGVNGFTDGGLGTFGGGYADALYRNWLANLAPEVAARLPSIYPISYGETEGLTFVGGESGGYSYGAFYYLIFGEPLAPYLFDPETGASSGPEPEPTLEPDPRGGGPDSPPVATGSGPAPAMGPAGVVLLRFIGLPIPSDGTGAQAPVTVWAVQSSSDRIQPPTRTAVATLNPATEGDHLPSVLNVHYEVEAQPVAGLRVPPRVSYLGTGGTQVITLSYAPTAGPGLLRDPVRVQLGEDASGIFIDSQVTVDYLEHSTVALHTPYRIGTETAPVPGVMAFQFVSSSRDRNTGLVTYMGQTLLGRLNDEYPFPDGYSAVQAGGYTPRQALETLLYAMRQYTHPDTGAVITREWLGWEALPELYLRGAAGPLLATIDALVIEKPDEAPGESAQSILRRFFEPFAGYGFRVSQWNRLEVTVPSWQPQAAVTTTLTHAQVTGATSPVRRTLALISTDPRATVTLRLQDADGAVTGGTETTLALTATPQDGAPGNTFVGVQVSHDGTQVILDVTNYANALFVLSVVAYDGLPRPVDVTLLDDDLAPGGTEVIDESGIVNVATVTSQGYVFETGEALPAASVRITANGAAPHYEPSGTDVLGAQWTPAEGVTVGGPQLSVTVSARAWASPFLGTPRELTGTAQTLTLPRQDGASVSATFDYAYSAFSSSAMRVVFTYRTGAAGGWVDVVPTVLHATSPTQYSWIAEFTADGQTFQQSSTKVTATYGEDGTGLAGLPASRAAYGRRPLTVDTGVFQVSQAVALSMARAIVQERLNPREVLTLPLAAPYRLGPHQRYVQAGARVGTLQSWQYAEGHTPQQSSSSLTVTLAVERTLALDPVSLPGGGTLTRATERRYGRARWGSAHMEA